MLFWGWVGGWWRYGQWGGLWRMVEVDRESGPTLRFVRGQFEITPLGFPIYMVFPSENPLSLVHIILI